MTTRKTLIEIASKGNWEYSNHENRCKYCAKYAWQNIHDDDCPFGALLKLIEDSNYE
jgi:hypothetical protein